MRVTSPIALIVEPRSRLGSVYQVLANQYQLVHVRTVPQAIDRLRTQSFTVAVISASFSATKSLELLTALKTASRYHLIPVVIMVDLSHRINVIPGTQWGEKIGVLCSLSETAEIASVLHRIGVV